MGAAQALTVNQGVVFPFSVWQLLLISPRSLSPVYLGSFWEN